MRHRNGVESEANGIGPTMEGCISPSTWHYFVGNSLFVFEVMVTFMSFERVLPAREIETKPNLRLTE